MALDNLGFELELDDRDGFMHPGDRLARVVLHGWPGLGQKQLAGIVAVARLGEALQTAQVDRVAVEQRLEVAVAQREAQHIRDQRIAAARGGHPRDIVVAPLDRDIVVGHQAIHHPLGGRAAVVDIAQDVEPVHHQALDEIGQGDDHLLALAQRHDRLDDAAIVLLLLDVLGLALGQQLFEDVGEARREPLAHLAAGVLLRRGARHARQVGDRLGHPGLGIVERP